MAGWIVFLPLLSALVVGLNTRRINEHLAQYVTSGFLVIAAILAGITFKNVAIDGQSYTLHLFNWISSGTLSIDWVIRVDVLTAVMLVVVTWVSAVVHIYSIGYMHDDEHTPRFFSYLSLFTFFMLMLVTADNLLQLFLGWEGVGLCSYLLIGFWYKRPSANAAAMKAFIVNRVGDLGFMLGLLLTFTIFGSIHFADIFAAVPNQVSAVYTVLGYDIHALTLIGILLFIGAMGKSAQLGLHTWLPDAMEGPTPVSALIHAATMVTAGVFLVARMSPLYEYAPIALMLITVVGATTALFAATIALTQNDIKKVIAYSTCSQLGYMFFACGVSAYSAGVFHLMTHAFFKALLFLGAGSVIHAMSGEQDMQKMGGLWKKIPFTYALFWIGSLAIAGIPFFAGYYSKNAILHAAHGSESPFAHYAFYVGELTSFLTAFYSWRLLILTFHGKPRCSKKVWDHVHESPAIMLVPLIVLVLGALFSGYLGEEVFKMVDGDYSFWRGALVSLSEHNPFLHHGEHPLWTKFVALAGITLAYIFYLLVPSLPTKMTQIFRPIYVLFYNKWYVDELYEFLFVRPAKALGTFFWQVGDVKIVDGLGPNGVSQLSYWFGGRLSKLQSGYLYHYAFAMLLGLVGVITWVWMQ
jgi:NADH-quinone oxidoreductase subunit L